MRDQNLLMKKKKENVSSRSAKKAEDALVYNKSDGSSWCHTESVGYGTLEESCDALALP